MKMTIEQKIELSNLIYSNMELLEGLVPTYMVLLNLNPELIYKSDRNRREVNKELDEYISNYIDVIFVVNKLKAKANTDAY